MRGGVKNNLRVKSLENSSHPLLIANIADHRNEINFGKFTFISLSIWKSANSERSTKINFSGRQYDKLSNQFRAD